MGFEIQDFHDLVRLLERYPEWRAELRRLVLSDEYLEVPERLGRIEVEIAEIKREIAEIKREIVEIKRDLTVLRRDVGVLKGWALESRFRERAPSYLGRWVRCIRMDSRQELADVLDEAVDRGVLTPGERDEALLLDVAARARSREDGSELHVVVEVSWCIDSKDVERVKRRAGLVRRATEVPVLILVAGCGITAEAAEEAQREGISCIMLEAAA